MPLFFTKAWCTGFEASRCSKSFESGSIYYCGVDVQNHFDYYESPFSIYYCGVGSIYYCDVDVQNHYESGSIYYCGVDVQNRYGSIRVKLSINYGTILEVIVADRSYCCYRSYCC